MNRPRASLAAKLISGRQGGVSTLFPIALPTMLGLLGGAADYAALIHASSRLQSAVDSAALSIAREMTLSSLSAQRVQDLAAAYVAANIGSANPATATGVLVEAGTAIEIKATQAVRTPLGLMPVLTGLDTLSASATARVPANALQQKLCLLSLGETVNGGLFMHNGAVLSAADCVAHSNSTQPDAVVVQAGSKVRASLLCARGGVKNLAGSIQGAVITDCPLIKNPLVDKVEPPSNGPCDHSLTVILSGTKTLNPGTYCNGIIVLGNAQVKLNPGIYVVRDGPFLAAMSSSVIGDGVSILLTGKYATLRLHDAALVEMSAPTSGTAAGMLVWELKGWVPGGNSWKSGGCGSVPPGATPPAPNGKVPVNIGPAGCATLQSYVSTGLKKINEHQINSDRARKMTGTIYLPQGLLLVDSRQPVADQSPFTIMVVNKLDLYDGPNLTLNTNYQGSPVPVPAGLGIIGAKNVSLGK